MFLSAFMSSLKSSVLLLYYQGKEDSPSAASRGKPAQRGKKQPLSINRFCIFDAQATKYFIQCLMHF